MSRSAWIVSGLLLAGIAGGFALMKKARGLRNNNPGNIKLTDIPWQGKVPNDLNTDGTFEQFYKPVFGIRAMARDLYTGYQRGQTTPRQIISEYAPPSENDTGAYIFNVSRALGIKADETMKPKQAPQLIAAIIKHENGINPYSMSTIETATTAAGWEV